jgi:solute carrier family 25 carnitine/acylcarnitine transporter 20/29
MEISYALSYFIQGGLSGMVGLTLSHPFDTIKTHCQDGLKPPRSFRALYRGLIPPLLGVGLEKSLVFGTYNSIKEPLINRGYGTNTSCLIAGAIAGFNASFIVTPAERLKILLQTNQPIPKITTLYKGFSATLTRETPGFAIYFTVYENLYNSNMNLFSSFLCGGISGACSWVFIYPQDIIKTRIQSEQSNGSKNSYFKHISNIYKERGVFGFYRGFHYALMRAVPLHGGTFCTFELLKMVSTM